MKRYYFLRRPPAPGAMPKTNSLVTLSVCECRKEFYSKDDVLICRAWGYMECDKLTQKDIDDYGLLETELEW